MNKVPVQNVIPALIEPFPLLVLIVTCLVGDRARVLKGAVPCWRFCAQRIGLCRPKLFCPTSATRKSGIGLLGLLIEDAANDQSHHRCSPVFLYGRFHYWRCARCSDFHQLGHWDKPASDWVKRFSLA
jgi:hypothetical protein